MSEIAVWDEMNCPKCGGYFVAQDEFGFFCVVDGCGWTDWKEDENDETDRASR